MCDGFGLAYDCSIKLNYHKLYPATINHSQCFEYVNRSAQKIVRESNFKLKIFGLAGEDFSFFAYERPSCYFYIGSAPANSLIKDETVALIPHSLGYNNL